MGELTCKTKALNTLIQRFNAFVVCVIDLGALFRDMLAVDAAMDSGGLVRQAEDLGQLLLGGADAPGVAADKVVAQFAPDGLPGGILLRFLQDTSFFYLKLHCLNHD